MNSPPPLDTLLTTLNISNADLVKASTEQLSFKQVQKARRGKPVTPNIQGKILRALNAYVKGGSYALADLFDNRDGTQGPQVT